MPHLRIFDALSFVFFFILLPAFLFWALSMDVTWNSLKLIYLRCGMVGILYFVLREAYNGYKPSALIHKIGNHYDLSETRRHSLSKNVFRIKLIVVLILGVAALYDLVFIIIPMLF